MPGVKADRKLAKGAGNRSLLLRMPFEEAEKVAGEVGGEKGETEVAAVIDEDDGDLRDRLAYNVALS